MVIYVKELNVKIEISGELLRKMLSYEQAIYDDERGGILLGMYDSQSYYYKITDFTVPNEFDQAGQLFFVRSKHGAQQVINEQWRKSHGLINYLGEWHTHPEKKPKPSAVDLSLIQQIIEDESAVWPEVLMIILGQKDTATLIVTTVADNRQFEIGVNIKYAGIHNR